MKGDVAGMGFAEGPHNLDPATGRQRRGFPGCPALADARRSHHIDHTTAATDRAVHHGLERCHLPAPADQARLGAPERAIPWADRQQPARAHRFVGPLDAYPFGFGQHHGVLDQPGGRFRQHHPARGRHRFHPLGEPDGLAGRGVTHGSRTELAGDHPTRVQAHPQLQRHTVTTRHLGRQARRPPPGWRVRQGTPEKHDPPTQPERRTMPSPRRQCALRVPPP